MTARFFAIAEVRHNPLCLILSWDWQFFRLRGSIWYSKIWCWYRFYGCDEARVGDEVYCASGHGWSARNLRADYCCHHQYRK